MKIVQFREVLTMYDCNPNLLMYYFFPIFRALTGVGIQIQMVGLLCDILIFKES